jgi:hypothetical protein
MKKASLILILVSLLAHPASSFADMYFGATVGQSSSEKMSTSGLSYFNYTNIDTESSDTSDTAFSIFAGYDFKIYDNDFAVEVGWVDFGKNSLSASGQDFLPGGTGRRAATVVKETNAITLSMVGKKKVVKDLFAFGKLGLSAWDASSKFRGTVTDSSGNLSGSTSQTSSDNGYDVFLGVGVGYGNVMIQFERYRMNESDINYISLGFKI